MNNDISYHELSSSSASSSPSEALEITKGISVRGMKHLSEFGEEVGLEVDGLAGEVDSDWSDCSEEIINIKTSSSTIDDNFSHSDSGSMSLGSSGVSSYSKSNNKRKKNRKSREAKDRQKTCLGKEAAAKVSRNKVTYKHY